MKTATIETSRGTIKVNLHDDLVPKTVANFEKLAKQGFYNGLKFHRVIEDFMALGAVSYIYAETRNRSLLIQAFHTFPDDCAIVKCQSVFELP